MSRSRKKIPIGGIAAASSEKQDKRRANRKARHRVRLVLAVEPRRHQRLVGPCLREVSDVWVMAKDGKRYFDARRYPQEVRR